MSTRATLLVFIAIHTVPALACDSGPARQQDPAVRKGLLDELLADYRSYGLPLPPRNARLVKLETGFSIPRHGKPVPHFALGFEVKKPSPSGPAEFLIGVVRGPNWWKGKIAPVEPEPGIVKGIELSVSGLEFETPAGLATAIQCHERGWSSLATALLEVSLEADFLHHFPYKDVGDEIAPKTRLAFLAWAHQVNELLLIETDRRTVLRRLRALIKAEPRLDVEGNHSLISSLEAALVPSKAQPGSIEALIDSLIDLKHFALWDELPPELLKLVDLGFEAVPDLIAHLDDRRLTGYREQSGISSFPAYPWRVKDLCFKLLAGLAGRETAMTWTLDERDTKATQARALAWFDEARKAGELAYLLRTALPPGDWPDRHVLRVLARKHPEDLARTYQQLLEKRPEMQSWTAASEVARSALPPARKVELLSAAGRHPSLRHRYAALWELKDLGAGPALKLLIEALEALPKTPPLPYGSGSESSFVLLVQRIGDRRAWEALAQAARRADVGLRIELIDSITSQTDIEKRKAERLSFLSGFLSDGVSRRITEGSPEYDYRSALEEFKTLEVRDLAAMKMASILDLPETPRPEWSAGQWADLRAKVTRALER